MRNHFIYSFPVTDSRIPCVRFVLSSDKGSSRLKTLPLFSLHKCCQTCCDFPAFSVFVSDSSIRSNLRLSAHLWSVGGNRNTRRKPMQTQGECANSTQTVTRGQNWTLDPGASYDCNITFCTLSFLSLWMVCLVCIAWKKQYFSLYANTCDNNKSNQNQKW